jgi:hypothetical protein
LTLLDAPDFTRLATGNPKSGPALPPGSGGSRGDARHHSFPSPRYTAYWRSRPKFHGRADKEVQTVPRAGGAGMKNGKLLRLVAKSG